MAIYHWDLAEVRHKVIEIAKSEHEVEEYQTTIQRHMTTGSAKLKLRSRRYRKEVGQGGGNTPGSAGPWWSDIQGRKRPRALGIATREMKGIHWG
jgi:hypothetical protein